MKEKNKIFLVLKGSKKTIFLIKRIKKIFSNSKIILIDKDKNCVAKNYAHKFINVDSENLQKIYKNISKKNLFMCITRSSGPSSVIALNLDSLDLTDFDSFKCSVGKRVYGHLDRIEEKQPILDINKPDYDEYELDFKNLIGKKIYTHCRDRSTELLKMKRVKL